MPFSLAILLGNDAMNASHDVADALQQLASRFENATPIEAEAWADARGAIRDANGNTVGSWQVVA